MKKLQINQKQDFSPSTRDLNLWLNGSAFYYKITWLFFARDSDIHVQANRELFSDAVLSETNRDEKCVPSDLKRYKSSIEN